MIAGGLLAHPVAELGRAEMRDDDDGWTNEGGSFAAEVTASGAAAARR